MRADPAAQAQLLTLADLDARSMQLQHQRRSLPQHAEIEQLQADRTSLIDQRRDAQVVLDDLDLAQRKADNDVEQVKARRQRDSDRIDQGLITSPKDLERMNDEIASLDKRIAVLEDEELEIMEQVETAQAALDELTSRAEATDRRLTDLIETRDAAVAEIDRELAELVARREPATTEIPDDLLALYDRLREQKGVGAAELRARRCGGCQLTLDNAELSTIRGTDPDVVVRCEECQRILVRTDESGL